MNIRKEMKRRRGASLYRRDGCRGGGGGGSGGESVSSMTEKSLSMTREAARNFMKGLRTKINTGDNDLPQRRRNLEVVI